MDVRYQEIQSYLKSNDLSIIDGLKYLESLENVTVKFSTSFGLEDQVLTHLISTLQNPEMEVFTLDTGRLFHDTYNLWSKTLAKYPNILIKAYYPKEEILGEYVTKNGINAFYESIELRKTCCGIRKVEPLKRALANTTVWITGLRGDTTNARSDFPKVSWDESFQLIKYNPLINWTIDEVKNFVKTNNIPYNTLYDKGFASIGCAPCTRAINEGEPERAGRWWWENTDSRECGLHVTANTLHKAN